MNTRFLFRSNVYNFSSILIHEVQVHPSYFITTCVLKHTSKRFFSANLNDKKLQTFSEWFDYANKQMFLTHPEEETEEAETIQQLLTDCHSPHDILQLIQDQNQINGLLDDELMLYYRALKNTSQSLLRKQDSLESGKSIISNILNNESFHVLLRKTLLASIHLKSNDLAYLFFFFGKFQLPHESFIVKYTIKAIHRRINDFFPKDIVLCNYAIKDYKICTPEMQSLSIALLMHLENLVCDEDFFLKTTSGSNANVAFQLSNLYGDQASQSLKKCLVHSISETSHLLKDEGSLFLSDAIKILNSLFHLKVTDDRLHEIAIKVIAGNADQLTLQQRRVFSKYANGLQSKCYKTALLLENFSET